MGYSSFCSSLLVSHLLVFLLFISLSTAARSPNIDGTTDWITQICGKTGHSPFCRPSFPPSSSGDLHALGQISFKNANTTAQQNSNLIASLAKQATNPELKGRYAKCTTYYVQVSSDLMESEQAFNSNNLAFMRVKASNAFDGPADCDSNFNTRPAQPEPSQLYQANSKMEAFCNIISIISGLLEGG